jgi:hypothetical protein
VVLAGTLLFVLGSGNAGHRIRLDHAELATLRGGLCYAWNLPTDCPAHPDPVPCDEKPCIQASQTCTHPDAYDFHFDEYTEWCRNPDLQEEGREECLIQENWHCNRSVLCVTFGTNQCERNLMDGFWYCKRSGHVFGLGAAITKRWPKDNSPVCYGQ